MPTKRQAKKQKPVSAKTRAADDKLREALRTADLKTFGKALVKAVRSASPR